MAKLTINDLVESKELSSEAMSTVRGGWGGHDQEAAVVGVIDQDQDFYNKVNNGGIFSPVLIKNKGTQRATQDQHADIEQVAFDLRQLTALL